MGKIFKQLDDGSFVEITAEEKAEMDADPPVKDKTKSAIDELTATVQELAMATGETLNSIKEKGEEIDMKMAKYQETMKKGFPLPGAEIQEAKSEDEIAEICAPYNLAMQGKRLTDKLAHPNYRIPEEKREDLAKYMVLFLKAAYFQDPVARQAFIKHYGPIRVSPDVEVKTPVGDAGNIFPVPDILEAEILAFMRESSVTLQYARNWDMVSEKESFPRETSSVTVGWGNTTPESDPGVEEFELTATEMSAYTSVRNTTLADARSDVVSWLTENMAEAAGLELDNKAFNGLGTDNPFICSGILSAACGNSVTMASGSTAFSDLYADVLSEMIGALDGLKKGGGRFWMNGSILHYVRTLKDDQNRPIFVDTVGSPVSGQIYGYPYSEVIRCPSTSGANTAFVAFGNLRYFAVGRRLDTTSLQVDPYGLWTTNRTRFKIYQRWALSMGLPGGFVRLLTAAS